MRTTLDLWCARYDVLLPVILAPLPADARGPARVVIDSLGGREFDRLEAAMGLVAIYRDLVAASTAATGGQDSDDGASTPPVAMRPAPDEPSGPR